MKVRLRHVLVADSVIMDSLTNKISAIGIFDVIQIDAGQKSRLVNFFVTAQLIIEELKDGDAINVELQLIKPSNSVEKTVNLSLNLGDFPEGSKKTNNIPIIVNFNGVEFSEEDIGTYSIKIKVNGEEPEVSSIGSFEAVKILPENK